MLAGSSSLLGGGGIGLNYLGYLLHALIDLLQGKLLLIGSLGNACHDVSYGSHIPHNLAQCLGCLVGNAAACLHLFHGALNHIRGLLGSLGTAGSQVAHFFRYHSKALAVLSGTGSLYSRIQCQYIGLEGNLINYLDNLGNIHGRSIDFLHGSQHFLHLLVAHLCPAPGAHGQLIGLLRVLGVACRLGSNLGNGSRQLLHGSCLLGSTLGKGHAGIRHILSPGSHLIRPMIDFYQYLPDTLAHDFKAGSRISQLIAGAGNNLGCQIAISNPVRRLAKLNKAILHIPVKQNTCSSRSQNHCQCHHHDSNNIPVQFLTDSYIALLG